MAIVARSELMKSLVAVDAGLSNRDILEQSSCYIFREGRIWTYNDDVACSIPLPPPMEKMECAVPAVELRGLLARLDEERVDISLDDEEQIAEGQLVLKTKRRRAGIRVHLQIASPVGEISLPERWDKIPDGLEEAVDTVHECAGKDESTFVLTCLRFTSAGVEASDGYQAIRYRLKTGLNNPILVKQREMMKVIKLDLEEWAMTESWLHSRNSAGLIASCRRWNERYPNLTPYFEVSGQETTLPKSLVEAVSKVEIFVDTKTNIAGLTVDLNSTRLLLRGEGPVGWYEERQRVQYSGKALRFRIAPRLLREVCHRSDRCVIGEDKLQVVGDHYIYVTCLAIDKSRSE